MKLPAYILTLLMFTLSFLPANAQIAYPRFQKHTVTSGETALEVANKFNVSLTDFCLLNDFPKNVVLKPGQVVLIKQLKVGEQEIVEAPVKKETVKTTTTTVTREKTTVKKEEIATSEPEPSHEKTTVKKETKPVTEKTTVVLESKPVVKEKTTTKKETVTEEPFVVPPPSTKAVEVGPHGVQYTVSKTGYHIVEPKQTFFRIALIYGMSVDELKELNGMSNYNISVGQKLKVKK